MRTIEWSSRFKRDYKREQRGQYRDVLSTDFPAVITQLANDIPLAARYADHSLSGNWQGCRDCHIKPDLVLIYEKPDANTLTLRRLGTHSELGI